MKMYIKQFKANMYLFIKKNYIVKFDSTKYKITKNKTQIIKLLITNILSY